MSDGSPPERHSERPPDGKRRQKKSTEAVDPEPKEDTESPEAAKTLHNILQADYSYYVKSWRETVERKNIKIDKEKKHGQIRKINWNDVASKAKFNQVSRPSGPFLCTLWEDAKGELWCISGQHTVLAIDPEFGGYYRERPEVQPGAVAILAFVRKEGTAVGSVPGLVPYAAGDRVAQVMVGGRSAEDEERTVPAHFDSHYDPHPRSVSPRAARHR